MIPPLLKVLSVYVLDNYRLKVALSNGKEGVFDMYPYLDKGGVFQELKDVEYFAKVSIVPGKGGIEWPNEQDLSASTLNSGLYEVQTKTVQEMLAEASEHCRNSEGSVYWRDAFNHVTKIYAAFFEEKYGDSKPELKTEHRDKSKSAEPQIRRARVSL